MKRSYIVLLIGLLVGVATACDGGESPGVNVTEDASASGDTWADGSDDRTDDSSDSDPGNGTDDPSDPDPGWDGHRPDDCDLEVPFYEIEDDGRSGDVVYTEEIDVCRAFAEYTDDKEYLHVYIGVDDKASRSDRAHLELSWPVGFADDSLGSEQTLEMTNASGVYVSAHPPQGEGASLSGEGRRFEMTFVPHYSGTQPDERVLLEIRELITQGDYRDTYARLHIEEEFAFLARLPELEGSACQLWRNWECERQDPSGCRATCDGEEMTWKVECPSLQGCTCETPEGTEEDISVLGSGCNECENAHQTCTAE